MNFFHHDNTATEGLQIGLFGGSFNPVHTGHIALARQMLRLAQLDEVWFMVSPLNPFKANSADLLADNIRLSMAQTALKDEKGLKACDYEFHLPKPSYTWDTLCNLSRDYPLHRFTLLIGADNWLAFDRWAHPEDIISHHRIAVYPRPGYQIDPNTLPPTVQLMDTRLYPVSSTDIRRRVKSGQSIAGLVPECIEGMVEKHYSGK